VQKSASPAVIAVCIIVLVVVVAVLGWYFLGHNSSKAKQMPANPMESMGAGAQQKLQQGGGAPAGPPTPAPTPGQ